jgi:hypothetical protein
MSYKLQEGPDNQNPTVPRDLWQMQQVYYLFDDHPALLRDFLHGDNPGECGDDFLMVCIGCRGKGLTVDYYDFSWVRPEEVVEAT